MIVITDRIDFVSVLVTQVTNIFLFFAFLLQYNSLSKFNRITFFIIKLCIKLRLS